MAVLQTMCRRQEMSGLHAVQSEPEARHKRSKPEHNLHDQASKFNAQAAVE